LIIKALQSLDKPIWSVQMPSSEFQQIYLPALKETGAWPELLKTHPYALYMGFGKAAHLEQETLIRSLSLLLEAEFKLKGSPVPGRIVLEELLISLVRLLRPAATRMQNLAERRLKTL